MYVFTLFPLGLEGKEHPHYIVFIFCPFQTSKIRNINSSATRMDDFEIDPSELDMSRSNVIGQVSTGQRTDEKSKCKHTERMRISVQACPVEM